MARPKPDFPGAKALRALADDDGRLAIRVTPGARTEGIEIDDGLVWVKVRAKPQDSAANAAVISLVAGALNIAPSTLELLRGATGREKLIKLPAA